MDVANIIDKAEKNELYNRPPRPLRPRASLF